MPPASADCAHGNWHALVIPIGNKISWVLTGARMQFVSGFVMPPVCGGAFLVPDGFACEAGSLSDEGLLPTTGRRGPGAPAEGGPHDVVSFRTVRPWVDRRAIAIRSRSPYPALPPPRRCSAWSPATGRHAAQLRRRPSAARSSAPSASSRARPAPLARRRLRLAAGGSLTLSRGTRPARRSASGQTTWRSTA